MDPNLYFRFMVPAWAGIIAALAVGSVTQADWVKEVLDLQPNQALVALVVAALASPTLGFVANTIVVAWCHKWQKGPEFSPHFARFKQRVKKAIAHSLNKSNGSNSADGSDSTNDPDRLRLLENAVKCMKPAAIVAHFEYRTDTRELLEWRRRARAAFFANWATVVAIVLGVIAALSVDRAWACASTLAQSKVWVVLVVLVVVVWLFIANAGASQRVVQEQQELWAAPWRDDEIVAFLLKHGTGLRPLPGAQTDGDEM